MLRKMGRALLAAGSFLHAGAQAQARWELEVSRTILRKRWKVLLVALVPVLLGLGIELAFAGLPDTIGGSKAYMPTFVTSQMFLGSILVGLLAGLITGVIGAGGGYILTPALMSFGVKGIMAVGTDQFHLFAKAIMGTTIHRKLGNVNVWLAVWFVVGSFCGVSLGGMINRAVYQKSPALSDALISAVYVVMLGLLGAIAFADWMRLRRGEVAAKSSVEATTGFAKWLQAIPLVPRVRFDEDVVPGGRSIAVYPVIITGFIVGFVAAIMGVGGGFLTFPMFVYGLGVSTFTTVGTDILQIIFTTCYSSIFQYAVYGFVFYTVALGMLLGSLLGVQIGALVTTVVKGAVIRAFYAITILAGFVNRACALPKKLADAGYITLAEATGKSIDLVGMIVFWMLVGSFGAWILLVFLRNVGRIRAGEVAASAGGH
ncbi:MAG: sulfite exporter TauE/SafE family protein [Bacillota bacterium]